MSFNAMLRQLAEEVKIKTKSANEQRKILHSSDSFTSTIEKAGFGTSLRERVITKLPSNEDYANLTTLFEGLRKELELKKSTPKNKIWFERSYVPCDIPAQENIHAYCIDRNSPQSCQRCLNDPAPCLTVNFPNCLPTLIELFRRQADAAYNDSQSANNGRFILNGYAGEGKSTWLNRLTSEGQDILWDKKLINIKIPASNGKLLDQYKAEITSYNIDKHASRFQQVFWNIVSTKFMRMFFDHYYDQKTVYFVATDFLEKLSGSNEAAIDVISTLPQPTYNIKLYALTRGGDDNQFISITKTDLVEQHIVAFKITLHGGPMHPEKRDQYISLLQDNEWKETIENIFKKSQSTLSNQQVREINSAVEEIRGSLGEQTIANDWEQRISSSRLQSEQYQRTTYFGVNQVLADTIVRKLLGMGYRFLVVVDGVDPHHSTKNEADVSISFIRASMLAMSEISASVFKPVMLLALRNETMDRLRLHQLTPQQIAGNIQELRVGRADFKEIMRRRISNVTLHMQGEYNKTYSLGCMDLLDRYLNIVLAEYFATKDYLAIAFGLRVPVDDLKKSGFLLLEYLLRRNHRHALTFCVQLLRSLFSKLIEKGQYTIPRPHTHRNENDAKRDLDTAYRFVENRRYLFWNALLARDRHVYTEYYKYSLGKARRNKKGGKDYWIDREVMFPALGAVDRAFGTIPNLFSFIHAPKPETGLVSKSRNKLGMRIRIMQLVANRKPRASEFAQQFGYLFEISYDEVIWEIDELILMGLLADADRDPDENSDGTVSNHLETLSKKELRIEATIFWQTYKAFMFSPHVLYQLLPSTWIPEEHYLCYENYTNFSVISSNAHFKQDVLANCFASRCIVLVTLLSYMAEHEVDTIRKIKQMSHNHRDAFNALTNHGTISLDSIMIFKDTYEHILARIEKFTGINGLPSDVRNSILDKIRSHLKKL